MQDKNQERKKTFSEEIAEMDKNPPTLRVKLLAEAARNTRPQSEKQDNVSTSDKCEED